MHLGKAGGREEVSSSEHITPPIRPTSPGFMWRSLEFSSVPLCERDRFNQHWFRDNNFINIFDHTFLRFLLTFWCVEKGTQNQACCFWRISSFLFHFVAFFFGVLAVQLLLDDSVLLWLLFCVLFSPTPSILDCSFYLFFVTASLLFWCLSQPCFVLLFGVLPVSIRSSKEDGGGRAFLYHTLYHS